MADLFDQKQKAVYRGAHEIIVMLEKKYAAPSWAFFTEVKSAVGYSSRRADGIAVAMWRSLGLEIHGFEVKSERSDWLRELKDGGKSDEIFQYCDRWWIVAGNDSIVQHGELPPTWGLQVADGRGIKVKTKAPKLQPVPLTTEFIAEILRRQYNSAKEPELLKLEYQRGLQAGKESATPFDLKYQIEHADKLKKRIEDFEKASGIKIDSWQWSANIGAAVKAVLEHGPKELKSKLEYARDEVQRLATHLNETIEKLSKNE